MFKKITTLVFKFIAKYLLTNFYTTLQITECFTSIQGEGIHQGVPSHFIRLHGCSMKCPWCDSKYSWNEYTTYTYNDILELFELLKKSYWNVTNLVITGGEPFEQDIRALIILAKSLGWTVEVETNGNTESFYRRNKTFFQFIDLLVVSPKLLSIPHIVKYKHQAFTWFPFYKTIFKFVAETAEDVDNVITFCTYFNIHKSKIWIMPKGTTRDEIAFNCARVLPRCLHYDIKLSDRFHIMIWGSKRGV